MAAAIRASILVRPLVESVMNRRRCKIHLDSVVTIFSGHCRRKLVPKPPRLFFLYISRLPVVLPALIWAEKLQKQAIESDLCLRGS